MHGICAGRGTASDVVVVCNTLGHVSHELFDPDLLDEEDPFELDTQAAHLFKHPHLGVQDVLEVWGQRPADLSRQATGTLADVRRGRRPGPRRSTSACQEQRYAPLSAHRLL